MITRWTMAGVLWLGAALSAGCAHRPAKAGLQAPPRDTAPADVRTGAAAPSDEQRFRDAIAIVRQLRAQPKVPAAASPPAATAAPATSAPPAVPAPEAPAQDQSGH